MKHDLVTLVVTMILKDAATFPVLYYSFSILYFGLGLGVGLKNLVLFTSLIILLIVDFSHWRQDPRAPLSYASAILGIRRG